LLAFFRIMQFFAPSLKGGCVTLRVLRLSYYCQT
jgi:hypothetical protein